MDVLDLRAVLHSVHVLHCPCLFSPEQVQEMNLEPCFPKFFLEYQRRDFVSSMILTTDLRKLSVNLFVSGKKTKTIFQCLAYTPPMRLALTEFVNTLTPTILMS